MTKTIYNISDGILTPCNVACGSGIVTVNSQSGSTLQCDTWLWDDMPWCHWIRPNVRHIGILHLVSISTTSPQTICHSAPVSEILSKSDHPRQKKWRHVDFQDGAVADLSHRGFYRSNPIIGSLKSSYGTSYRSSMDTVALNCLAFEKIAFVFLHFGDRQTNRWTRPSHEAALADSRCRERRLNRPK